MTAEAGLAKGDLKFTLEGERLHGSWVLVRMKNDRMGGKRTNWLLIKHRDAMGARGRGRSGARRTSSVASGRDMAAIAAGKGRAPKPFMASARRAGARADAVWDSRDRARRRAAGRSTRRPMPDFLEPQLCHLGRPAARRRGLGARDQVRRLPHAAADRGRRGGAAHPQGARLDRPSSAAIAEAAARAAGLRSSTARSWRSTSTARPISPRCRRRCPKASPTAWSSSPSTCCSTDTEDLRPLPLAERKARLQALLAGNRLAAAPLRRPFRDRRRRGAAARPAGCRWKGIVSKRLDAPYRSGRGESWVKAKCRAGHEVVIGGWTTTGEALFRSLLVGAHRGDHFVYVGRVGTGFGAAKAARRCCRGCKPSRQDRSPFTGDRRAAQAGRACTGSSPSWSPRSSSPAGPPTGWCGRRRSRACARTSRPRRCKPRTRPPARQPRPRPPSRRRAPSPRRTPSRRPAARSSWASPSRGRTSRSGRRRAATASRSPSSTWPATTRRSGPG